MNKSQPPKSDEIEVSLFGPGVGECIVVHMGGGNWMVVDSFVAESGRPIALDYLESLGVDVGRQVKLVIATHWHDDHICGLGNLLTHASSAEFACSNALLSPHFFKLVAADEEIKCVAATSGTSEFAYILQVLARGSRSKRGPDHWASGGSTLFRGPSPVDVEVIALSPSAQTVSDAHGALAKAMFPQLQGRKSPLLSVSPNASSVVILVKSRGNHFLLGADLETHSSRLRGWKAVLDLSTRPNVKAVGYKVAHHGSSNSDDAAIWNTLLVDDPHAFLTTYSKGRKPLPSQADVTRLRSRTDLLYCTTWPTTVKPPRRKGVDGLINKFVRNRRAVPLGHGHIRLRSHFACLPDEISVETFGTARKL